MNNPIKNNRIVNDITFATRLRSFLDGIQVCDLCGEEELDYLMMVADNLVEYQRETCTDEAEKKYFANMRKSINGGQSQ